MDWNTQPPSDHCILLPEADSHEIPNKQQRLHERHGIRTKGAGGTQGLKALVSDTLISHLQVRATVPGKTRILNSLTGNPSNLSTLGISLCVGHGVVVSCSVANSCLTLHNLMNCSTPGFPVLHYVPEFTQAHVHWVHDAIQPSHPLPPSFPLALNLSQHHGLFQRGDYWLNAKLLWKMFTSGMPLRYSTPPSELHILPLNVNKFNQTGTVLLDCKLFRLVQWFCICQPQF